MLIGYFYYYLFHFLYLFLCPFLFKDLKSFLCLEELRPVVVAKLLLQVLECSTKATAAALAVTPTEEHHSAVVVTKGLRKTEAKAPKCRSLGDPSLLQADLKAL